MLLSLAACKTSEQSPEAEPTLTEQITEAPAEEPTEKPAEAPAAEPTLAPIEDHPLPEDPDAVGDCIKDAELIAFLPYGEDENSLGFIPSHPGYEDDTFPNAFAVNNGKVYIADCVNGRIAVCENGKVGSIRFADPENMGYYTTMTVFENKIYVCCTQVTADDIDVYDLNGALLESIAVPTQAQDSGVFTLFVRGGSLWMYDDQLAVYELKDGRFVEVGDINVDSPGEPDPWVRFGDMKVKLDTGENSLVSINRILGDRIYCTVFDRTDGLEISYRVYNSAGELLGATVVDPRNVRAYPDSAMFVSEEGEVYVMCCMNDGVYITKPHLRTSSQLTGAQNG